MPLNCCVKYCKSVLRKGGDVSFYRITPATDDSSVTLRNRWKAVIEACKDQPSLDHIQNPRICSKHFISGACMNNIISINITYIFFNYIL